MANLRRLIPVLAIFTAVLLVWYFYDSAVMRSWETLAPAVGMGEYAIPYEDNGYNDYDEGSFDREHTPKPQFKAGTPKEPGYNYSRILIIPKMHDEDTKWIKEELRDLKTAIYIADKPDAPLHPPKNKGHEVMIYLTYIIDHYEDLPDIMMFMHAHRYTWHNNDLLGYDAVEMITRLSSDRVTREGYMNMRCHWMPGCPDWMHPGETDPNVFKQEETLLAKTWAEIFPLDPVPKVLAQPCCSQFALSRERVQSIPKRQFIYYRDWLLQTRLKDYVSGRVWEYMWQFALTGRSEFCPAEHVCYCDGYGICFGTKEKYLEWKEVRGHRDEWNGKLDAWKDKKKAIEKATEEGRLDDAAKLPKPEPGKNEIFKAEIDKYQKEMDRLFRIAEERGRDPQNRLAETGKHWGFQDPD